MQIVVHNEGNETIYIGHIPLLPGGIYSATHDDDVTITELTPLKQQQKNQIRKPKLNLEEERVNKDAELDLVWGDGGFWTQAEIDNDTLKSAQCPVEDIAMELMGYPLNLDGCQHEWQHYKGLIEEYEFCTKCDEKRYKDG